MTLFLWCLYDLILSLKDPFALMKASKNPLEEFQMKMRLEEAAHLDAWPTVYVEADMPFYQSQ